MEKYDIFISWSNDPIYGVGIELVSEFHRFVETVIFKKQLRVFNSSTILNGKWEQQVERALKDSKFGIFLLTDKAVNSDWVKHEFERLTAYNEEKFQDHENILCFMFPSDLVIDDPIYKREQLKSFNKNDLFAFFDIIAKYYHLKNYDFKNKIYDIAYDFFAYNITSIISNIDFYKTNKKQLLLLYSNVEKYISQLPQTSDPSLLKLLDNLKSENETLRSQIGYNADSIHSIDNLKEKIKKISDNLALELAKNLKNKQIFNNLQTEYNKISTNLSDLKYEYGQLHQRNDQLEIKISQADDCISSLQYKIENLSSINKSISSKHDKLQTKYDKLQTKYDKLQIDNNKKNRRFPMWLICLGVLLCGVFVIFLIRRDINTLNQINQFNVQMDSLQAIIDSAQCTIDYKEKYEYELKNLNCKITDLILYSDSLNAISRHYEMNVAKYVDQINNLQRENYELKCELKKKRK